MLVVLLRRFGRMTKEMLSAHRTDILAHALLYYGLRTKAKLCMHSMLAFTLPCFDE